MADGGYFEKMADQKACGCVISWTIGWIAFKLDAVVLWILLMIWLPFCKMADAGHFEKKIAILKAYGRDILRTLRWITFKFHAAVLWAFLMLWLTFGKKS